MSDPTDLASLQTFRAAALSTYASALSSLQTAYVELGACDRALTSNQLASAPSTHFPAESPESVPFILQHSGAPGPSGRWSDLVQSRAKVLLAGLGFSV